MERTRLGIECPKGFENCLLIQVLIDSAKLEKALSPHSPCCLLWDGMPKMTVTWWNLRISNAALLNRAPALGKGSDFPVATVVLSSPVYWDFLLVFPYHSLQLTSNPGPHLFSWCNPDGTDMYPYTFTCPLLLSSWPQPFFLCLPSFHYARLRWLHHILSRECLQ